MKRSIVIFVQRLFLLPFMEKLLVWTTEKFPHTPIIRKFAPQNYEYSAKEVRICKRYGINYRLYIRDYQSWLLYFFCDYDSSFDILKNVKEGFTIIDVGGNIGQTAMMMAKQTGLNGRVISFEPFQKTYEDFKYNLLLNKNIQNITLENIGLGERSENLQMVEECETNSGGNRIAISEGEKKEESPYVHIISLDEYIEKQKVKKIDLIKIDVEGFEMKVLKGAKNTLKKDKPDLFIEIDNDNLGKQGDSAESMINFLLENNYAIFDVSNSKKIMNYNEMLPKSRDIFCKYQINI